MSGCKPKQSSLFHENGSSLIILVVIVIDIEWTADIDLGEVAYWQYNH